MSDPPARTSARGARRPRAVLVPGFNGTARQPLLVALAALLESRGVEAHVAELPRGRPSAGLAAEVRALDEQCGRGAVMLVGRSFGGRVCARLAATRAVPRLVLLGFPVRPPGRRRPDDEAALAALTVPTLIVQGARDPLGPLSVVRPLVAANPSLSLLVLPKAGHAFGARTQEALTAAADWLTARP